MRVWIGQLWVKFRKVWICWVIVHVKFVFLSCQWLFLGRQWLNLGRWWVGWLNSGWYDIIYTGTNADDQQLINLGRWWLTLGRWWLNREVYSSHFAEKVPVKKLAFINVFQKKFPWNSWQIPLEFLELLKMGWKW